MDGGLKGSMKKFNPSFTTYTKVKAPCMNCSERKLHCHDTCARYQEYNEQMVQIRNRRAEEVKTNDAIYSAAIGRNKSLMQHGRRSNLRGQK